MSNLTIELINKSASLMKQAEEEENSLSHDAGVGALAGAGIVGTGQGLRTRSAVQDRILLNKAKGNVFSGTRLGIRKGIHESGKGLLLGGAAGMAWNAYKNRHPAGPSEMSLSDLKYASVKHSDARYMEYYQNALRNREQDNAEDWVTTPENRTDVTGML